MNTKDKQQGTAELATTQNGTTQKDTRVGRSLAAGGDLIRRGSDPFSMMRRLSDEMDQFLNRFGFGTPLLWPLRDRELSSLGPLASGEWAPQVEMFERDNQLVVRADLPGMHKEDLSVDVTDEAITIKGERREQHEENRGEYYHSERRYGSFFRRIPLPKGIDSDEARASYRDGVLEITMPAPERKRQGRQVEIQ